MKFYPEGVNLSLAKTFESIDEIKEAIMKEETVEGRVLLCDKEQFTY